jgi:hypothetical protein
VGDGGTGRAGARSLASLIERSGPDRFLYLGDVYRWRTASEFSRRYGSVYGRLARITAPTVGNHDLPTQKGYDPYWKRVKGRRPPSFYSFSVAGWQLLGLNSQARHGRGSAQLRWLRSRVSRPGTCRLAFWHRPRYSAGVRHGDQPDMAPVWRRLRGRARLVVGGHEHDMQRLKTIDGITQLVSGAGGASRHGLHRGDRRLAFGDDSHFGALRLELEPGLARIAFVSAAGRTLDTATARCRRR